MTTMTTMITVDTIMLAPGGPPCSEWTRERVERALAQLDCSSWEALAMSARAGGWRLVSLADLRRTACRSMSREQRIESVRRSVFIRVDAQTARWPDVSDDVHAVRGELLRWAAGDDMSTVELRALRDAAADTAYYAYAAAAAAAASASSSAYYAYAAAAAAAAAASASSSAYYADADAAAAADAYDAAAYDEAYDEAAYAEESWSGLLYMCRLLDGTVAK